MSAAFMNIRNIILKNVSPAIKDCIGQIYDNVTNMSDANSEVHGRIKKYKELANFTVPPTHRTW